MTTGNPPNATLLTTTERSEWLLAQLAAFALHVHLHGLGLDS